MKNKRVKFFIIILNSQSYLLVKKVLKNQKADNILYYQPFFLYYNDSNLYQWTRFIAFLPRKYGSFVRLKNALAMRFLLPCT